MSTMNGWSPLQLGQDRARPAAAPRRALLRRGVAPQDEHPARRRIAWRGRRSCAPPRGTSGAYGVTRCITAHRGDLLTVYGRRGARMPERVGSTQELARIVAVPVTTIAEV